MASGELVGKQVILRELCEDFFKNYMDVFSPKVQRLLCVSDVSSELDYLQQCVTTGNSTQSVFFCVFDCKSEALIGALEIRDYARTSNQLYSWLHEDYWGAGRYQEALRLVAQEYFARSGQPFFCAHVNVSNKRSYHALKKYGFADVGLCAGPHGKQYKLVFRNA